MKIGRWKIGVREKKHRCWNRYYAQDYKGYDLGCLYVERDRKKSWWETW